MYICITNISEPNKSEGISYESSLVYECLYQLYKYKTKLTGNHLFYHKEVKILFETDSCPFSGTCS